MCRWPRESLWTRQNGGIGYGGRRATCWGTEHSSSSQEVWARVASRAGITLRRGPGRGSPASRASPAGWTAGSASLADHVFSMRHEDRKKNTREFRKERSRSTCMCPCTCLKQREDEDENEDKGEGAEKERCMWSEWLKEIKDAFVILFGKI